MQEQILFLPKARRASHHHRFPFFHLLFTFTFLFIIFHFHFSSHISQVEQLTDLPYYLFFTKQLFTFTFHLFLHFYLFFISYFPGGAIDWPAMSICSPSCAQQPQTATRPPYQAWPGGEMICEYEINEKDKK